MVAKVTIRSLKVTLLQGQHYSPLYRLIIDPVVKIDLLAKSFGVFFF